jgi:hypothetical protein
VNLGCAQQAGKNSLLFSKLGWYFRSSSFAIAAKIDEIGDEAYRK